MKPRDSLLGLLVAFLWGLNFVALHLSLEVFPPFFLLALRFALVALPAMFFIPKPDASWKTIALIGTAMSLGQFSFLYLALHLGMPAGLSSLIMQAQVLLSVLLGAVVLGEHPGRAQIAGLAVGAVGLTVIGVGRGLSAPIMPFLLLLLAATSWSIGNIITRTAKIKGGLGVTVWSSAVVPLPALALSLIIDGPTKISHSMTHLTWAAVLSLAFTVYASSHAAYGLWNSLLARYPVWQVTPFALIVPVFGMLSTMIFLGERPRPLEWFGSALLLLGVALAALAPAIQARRAKAGQPTETDVIAYEEPSA